MDDTIRKTQIKGTAYSFRPFTVDELTLVAELRYLNTSNDRYMRVIMKMLADAGGEEQWETLTDRLVAREIGLDDLSNAFLKLFERQLKKMDQESPDPAGDEQ
jgi:hypothetical protein